MPDRNEDHARKIAAKERAAEEAAAIDKEWPPEKIAEAHAKNQDPDAFADKIAEQKEAREEQLGRKNAAKAQAMKEQKALEAEQEEQQKAADVARKYGYVMIPMQVLQEVSNVLDQIPRGQINPLGSIIDHYLPPRPGFQEYLQKFGVHK